MAGMLTLDFGFLVFFVYRVQIADGHTVVDGLGDAAEALSVQGLAHLVLSAGDESVELRDGSVHDCDLIKID